jgi:hypothetical protein
MRRTSTAILAILLTAGIASTAFGRVRKAVGSHRFSVPNEFVISKGPFWLPPMERDSLLIVADPRPPLQDHHTVLLQSRALVCGFDGAGQMARIACGLETPTVDVAPPFEKATNGGNSTTWIKRTGTAPSAPRREIASCIPMSAQPEKGGLCLVVTNYKDLVLTTYLREVELPQLARRLAALRWQLQSWEVD